MTEPTQKPDNDRLGTFETLEQTFEILRDILNVPTELGDEAVDKTLDELKQAFNQNRAMQEDLQFLLSSICENEEILIRESAKIGPRFQAGKHIIQMANRLLHDLATDGFQINESTKPNWKSVLELLDLLKIIQIQTKRMPELTDPNELHAMRKKARKHLLNILPKE